MEAFWVRLLAYSLIPLILAAGHSLLDSQARTLPRRIELFVMYLLGISVGAGGLGGAFGHLVLPDIVAEGVGWPAGSPFQLEMGFANLALGVLGLVAVGRRDGFRSATIIAVTIIGGGATAVHVLDIVATGNLAPGNTVQNVANLLDPVLLIALTWLAARTAPADAESPAFHRWQQRQQPVVALAAIGVGTGFGLGYAVGGLAVSTLLGALGGFGVGWVLRRRIPTASAEPLRATSLSQR